MINLSNHECYFCQGLDRKTRTKHGEFVEAIREIDIEIDNAVKSNQFNSIPYLKGRKEYIAGFIKYYERKMPT